MRELKALEIAAKAKVTFDGTYWVVPSQTTSMKYRVLVGPNPSCGCDDFQLRKQPCKHIIAARIVCARDRGGKAPEIVADAVPKKPTCRQNWPAYNMAQAIEKRRLQALLYDLCQGVEEPPPPKTGRHPHSLRDRLFSMAYKVYSTFSARRFSCDLADAYERGYLTKIIPGLKVPQFLEDPAVTPILQRLIVQSSLPLRAVETVFAPDSTGFSTSRFVRWYDEKYGQERSGRDWVKAHAICGVKTNVVTAVIIEGRDAGDSPQFKPLVEQTAASGFTVKEVTADKAYLSHDNLAVVAAAGGTAFIPFKSNSGPGEDDSLWGKMYHYFSFRREEFLKHYHQRSNVESTFSMVKAKFKDDVRSKGEVAMKNEVLCKFLCHNVCCVIQAQCELGVEAVFWPAQGDEGDDPGILPLVRKPS